jgi:hypothetical protein
MALDKNKDGTVSISANGVWRPGCFENEVAAKKAQKLDDAVIQALQAKAIIHNDGIIKAEDLEGEA